MKRAEVAPLGPVDFEAPAEEATESEWGRLEQLQHSGMRKVIERESREALELVRRSLEGTS